MLTTYVVPDRNKIMVYNAKIAKQNKVKVPADAAKKVIDEPDVIDDENINTDSNTETTKEEDINSQINN
jgi:hypothetical protein